MKTSENLWGFDVFRGYRKDNGMKWVKSWNFLSYKGTIRLEEKNVGSLGKKCYYKKDIKYLFRAHLTFLVRRKEY